MLRLRGTVEAAASAQRTDVRTEQVPGNEQTTATRHWFQPSAGETVFLFPPTYTHRASYWLCRSFCLLEYCICHEGKLTETRL